MNQITWMVVIQESNFRLPAQQVLHKGNKYIKPVPTISHIRKIICSSAIKDYSTQGRWAFIVQLFQVLLRELTIVQLKGGMMDVNHIGLLLVKL